MKSTSGIRWSQVADSGKGKGDGKGSGSGSGGGSRIIDSNLGKSDKQPSGGKGK